MYCVLVVSLIASRAFALVAHMLDVPYETFFGTNCIFDSCMLDNAPPILSWERLSYSEYIARSPLLGPFCQGQEIKQMQRQIPRAKVDVLSCSDFDVF